MSSIRNSSIFAMLAFFILISAAGCKSKKKAMEAAAEKARIEQEAAARKKQQEEEARLREADEAARKAREAEEKAKRDAESAAAASTPKAKLSQYFSSISGASSVAAANSSINEAMTLFASAETPVLIVISESGGMKDYDKPTTIKAYLNYLKDQKKNINQIQELKFDGSGKITEVELRKN